jgi:ribosomal protein S18 acetylase RimI-like enzyme
MTSPLDNVIWNALTGPHARYAEGGSKARRYPPAFAPFHAMPIASADNFHALAELASPGDQIALFTRTDVEPTAEFEVVNRADMVQMVREPRALPPRPAHVQALGDSDAADMMALAEATKPGPFASRTHQLGSFFGIRTGGRLVAMAGERMHLAGYTEVSAVCTLASERGHGYGRELVDTVSAAIIERGETPFLHAFSGNTSAIGLYEKLGFIIRLRMRLTVLKIIASCR